MDKELAEKLIKIAPEALSDYGGDMRKTCMAWGFECSDGWYKILEELCQKVSKIPSFKFNQVKEKFGVLTVYFSVAEEERDVARKAVDDAEIKSSVTCETCGEPGKRKSNGGWLLVECKKCEEIHRLYKEVKDKEYEEKGKKIP